MRPLKWRRSWTATEDATGYCVEWSAGGETGWTGVDPEHSGTATTYSHTRLTASTMYYYRVTALAGAAVSDPSDVVSATTAQATQKALLGDL